MNMSCVCLKVRGVVNLCEEYSGPIRQYEKLGISHLRLPTPDHFESTVEDLERAVKFIRKHRDNGSKVYVHCRAGHGRSAAAVFAWLLSKDPQADRLELNMWLCSLRNVRKTLWKQKNILNFHARLLKQQDECPDEESESDGNAKELEDNAFEQSLNNNNDSYVQ
jgi:atypical dual specificity phosphatase